MDFPILDLIDNESATEWLVNHFHPNGLKCPHCQASVEEARPFRQTTASQLTVYRCLSCDGVYNLYSSTVFQQKQFTPAQVVLLPTGGVPRNTHGTTCAGDWSELPDGTFYASHPAIQCPSDATELAPCRRSDRDGRNVSKCRGKKVNRTPIRQTLPDAVPTSVGDGAPMPMTDRRLLARWDDKAVK